MCFSGGLLFQLLALFDGFLDFMTKLKKNMIAKTNRIDNAVNGKIIMLLIGLKFEFSIKVCSNQTTRVGWVFWTVSRETDK